MISFKNFFKRFDFIITCVAAVLSLMGLIAVYSATKSYDTYRYIIVQGAAILICVVLFLITANLNYEYISPLWKFLYAFNILILLLVIFLGIGSAETGTTGWFRIGGISIQPAEIAKVIFIITFACHIDSVHNDINKPKTLLKLFLHMAIPVGLILLQPDFGTAIVFVVIFFIMLFIAGLKWKYIAWTALAVSVVSPVMYFFILSDYQKNRIRNFINPELDPTGSGYQVMQSKIAIGSGQLFGKGFLKGTQVQLGYLPEKHTDFIFAVIGEEFGLIGCLVIFSLLVILIARCIYIAITAKNNLGLMICVGVSAMYLFHTLENIGMTIGLMPVTGIPLPFVSYGGTSMVTNWLAAGLVVNVYKRNRIINF